MAGNFFADPKYSTASRPATPFANPTLPYVGPQAAANLQRTMQEVQQAQATAAATTAKTRADAASAQAAASQAVPQQVATTQQKQSDAQAAAFKASQEKLTLQRQRAQIGMFGDNINKTMDAVNQARELIRENPGQFDPLTYRIMQHVPGTAANKVAALIDPEHGPLASNQVLNTVNEFRDEAGSNPGGGGTPPRIFRSEIPLFVSQSGTLDPGRMGAAATMHTLDNMEYYGKRAFASVSGANPDDPAAIKQFGIPPMPTMDSAQAKLSGAKFNPNTDEVLFNDEGKPGQLSPSQQAQEQAYLKANPNATPEAFGSFLSSLTGRNVANAKQILAAYNSGRGLNKSILPDPRAVAIANQRLATGGNGGAAAVQGALSSIPFSNQIGGAIDTITGQGSPLYSVNRDANFLYNEGLAKNHPLPFYGGQIVGGATLLGGGAGAVGRVLQMGREGGAAQALLNAARNAPKTATTLGDVAYGAATNAGQNPDAPISAGVQGGLAGLTGNMLGRGVQALGGKAVSAAGQRLNDLGINVPIWPKLLPGGEARIADQNRQLNAEAFNQAANFVGGDSKGVGATALTDLRELGQDAYSHALNPVRGFQLTPEAQNGVSAAFNAANALKNPEARNYALNSLNQHIFGNFNNGVMNGEGFQGAYRGLSNDIGGVSRLADNGKISPSEQKTVTSILGQGQDALVQSLQASHPDAFSQFTAANNMWRHMNVIGKAMDAAKNSVDGSGNVIPTGAQLSTASSGNTRAYSGVMAAAQGDRPFNQLLNDINYAGAKSGGSGLAAQASHYALPTLGLLAGGGAGNEADGGEGAGIGALSLAALAAGLGSRPGQAALRRALMLSPNAITAGLVPLTPNLNNGSR